MRAIILAAGYGNRMRPLSDARHKALLEVGGETILGRIVRGLVENDVTDIMVVTGYRADEVEGYLRDAHPSLAIRFVRNERYRETNNIYSMSLAFEAVDIDDDVLLIECDLVCDPDIFRRIARTPHENAALVDRYQTGMDGTVVTIADGIVTSVIPPHLQGEDFSYKDKYKTLNIYKFSRRFCRESFQKLLMYYAKLIDDNCYYELILGILVYVQKATIHAEVIEGERWAEVDDPNDLRCAEYLFSPQRRREILDETMGGLWSFHVTDFCFLRNMYFPTPAILAELRNNLSPLLHSYGSRQEVLNSKLAFFLQCRPDRVQALSGAAQLFPFLREHISKGRVLLPRPTFGEYARVVNCSSYADRPGIDLEEVEGGAAKADTVVFVNPNNPTGTTLPTRWIHDFARRHPNKLFVVDESFIDFSDQTPVVSLLESDPLPNVLVLASLSKTLGVPGLRLGYVYTCDPDLHRRIGDWLPIWSLNSVAENLLEIVLKHRQSYRDSIHRTQLDRAELMSALERVPMVERVYPSEANFALVTLRGSAGEARALTNTLLERFDIYVKDVSTRLPGDRAHLRIAVRLPAENARLCAALSDLSAARDPPARSR